MFFKKEIKINPCPICDGEIKYSQTDRNLYSKRFEGRFHCEDCHLKRIYYAYNKKEAIKKWNDFSVNWLENEMKNRNYNKALNEACIYEYNNFKKVPNVPGCIINGHFVFYVYLSSGMLTVYFMKKEVIIDESFDFKNFLEISHNKNEALKVFDSELEEPFIVQGIIKENLQEILDDVLRYNILRERDLIRTKVNEKREEEREEEAKKKEMEKQAALELEKRIKEFEKVLEKEKKNE